MAKRWTCDQCGTRNEDSAIQCQGCGLIRGSVVTAGSAGAPALASPPTATASSHPRVQWSGDRLIGEQLVRTASRLGLIHVVLAGGGLLTGLLWVTGLLSADTISGAANWVTALAVVAGIGGVAVAWTHRPGLALVWFAAMLFGSLAGYILAVPEGTDPRAAGSGFGYLMATFVGKVAIANLGGYLVGRFFWLVATVGFTGVRPSAVLGLIAAIVLFIWAVASPEELLEEMEPVRHL